MTTDKIENSSNNENQQKFQGFDHLRWSEWFEKVLNGIIVEPVLIQSMYDIPAYIIAAYDTSQQEKNPQEPFFDGLMICFHDFRINDHSKKSFLNLLEVFKLLPLKIKYLDNILDVIKSRKYSTVYNNNFTFHQELIDVYYSLSRPLPNKDDFEKVLIIEIQHYHLTKSFGIFTIALNYFSEVKKDKVAFFEYAEKILFNNILESTQEKKLLINTLFAKATMNEIYRWIIKRESELKIFDILSIVKIKAEQSYHRKKSDSQIKDLYQFLFKDDTCKPKPIDETDKIKVKIEDPYEFVQIEIEEAAKKLELHEIQDSALDFKREGEKIGIKNEFLNYLSNERK